ncbi:hypothetical protein D3C85_1177910 [compost metagenome]
MNNFIQLHLILEGAKRNTWLHAVTYRHCFEQSLELIDKFIMNGFMHVYTLGARASLAPVQEGSPKKVGCDL